jgi:hypothetical protein
MKWNKQAILNNQPTRNPNSSVQFAPANSQRIVTDGPRSAELPAPPDPAQVAINRGSMTRVDSLLDGKPGQLSRREFPVVAGTAEPILSLAKVLEDAVHAVDRLHFSMPLHELTRGLGRY